MTTTAIPAADPGLPKIETIDSVYSEIGTLADVLDATYGILHNMHYGPPGGGRNVELDHVAALVFTASRMAKYPVAAVDDLPKEASA